MVAQTAQTTTIIATGRIDSDRNVRLDKVNSALLPAYALGVKDAQDGELCLPELYFVKAQDKYDYALGYNSIRASILATQIMERFEDAQHEAARLELGDNSDLRHGWQF